MALRNLTTHLRKYVQSFPIKFSESPLNYQLTKAMDSYESYIGVKEIKKIQQDVLKAEEAFIESSKARRTIQDGLLKVQQNLKQVRSKLDSMSRSDEAYLELITNEHKLIKNELNLLNELRSKEESERELFSSFSQRLREAHEFERLRQEKVKYLSILGSIIGAFLGILGTSINHALKMKDINKLVHTLETQMNTFSSTFSQEMSNHRSQSTNEPDNVVDGNLEQNLNNLSETIVQKINLSQQSIHASIYASQENIESQLKLNNLLLTIGLLSLSLPIVIRFISN